MLCEKVSNSFGVDVTEGHDKSIFSNIQYNIVLGNQRQFPRMIFDGHGNGFIACGKCKIFQ